MAAEYATNRQIQSFERPVFLNRLDCILGACRREPTTGGRERRDAPAVKENREEQELDQEVIQRLEQTFHD